MTEDKNEEREIIVPLRKRFLNTPKYKRVPKAIKLLKKFIAKHMKVYDRDLRKIKIDKYLNEELWFRGIRNPPAKIKVKVKKEQDNIIVELAEFSEKAKYKKAREERAKKTTEEIKKQKEAEKKSREEAEKQAGEKKEEKVEEKKEEKSESEKETEKIITGKEHKEMKLETKMSKKPKHQFRQALKK